MPNQAWVGPIVASQADGPSITTNSVDSSILPTACVVSLPSGFLQYAGQMLRLRATGRITTTAAGTLTFTVYFGAVKVWTGSANTVVSALTNLTFEVEILLTVRAVGSGTSANVIGVARVISGIFGTAGAVTTFLEPTSAPAVGTGFDSTASQAVDLRANFSLTGQTLVCHQYLLESLN